MSTEIYYYSGTGNSLYIAKELQRRIPESKLIPIISLLGEDRIQTKAETIGFVFPVYLMTLPVPVVKFLKKLDPASANYIFTAVTYGFSQISIADIEIKNALKKQGKTLNSFFSIPMISNSPAGLRPFADKNWVNQITKDIISKFDSDAVIKLDSIQTATVNHEKYHDAESPLIKLLKTVVSFIFHLMKPVIENSKIAFYADSTCDSCGTCEKVCLSGKIKMEHNKPVWRKDVNCFFCYACFNSCPGQSILITNIYTEKNGRYLHPGATVKELSGQK